jgi:hypothetical protein
LAIRTNTSAEPAFLLPLIIDVWPLPDFEFNRPPYFKDPGNVTFNYTIASNNDTYRFNFNLTSQYDDLDRITNMNVSSPQWGKLKLKYDEETQEPEEIARIYDMLTYDHKTTSLVLTLDGDVTNIVKYTGIVYEFKIILIDHQGYTAEKFVRLNLTLDGEWYKNWLSNNEVIDEIIIKQAPAGRITEISVFGEVTVLFNKSSNFQPKVF